MVIGNIAYIRMELSDPWHRDVHERKVDNREEDWEGDGKEKRINTKVQGEEVRCTKKLLFL